MLAIGYEYNLAVTVKKILEKTDIRKLKDLERDLLLGDNIKRKNALYQLFYDRELICEEIEFMGKENTKRIANYALLILDGKLEKERR